MAPATSRREQVRRCFSGRRGRLTRAHAHRTATGPANRTPLHGGRDVANDASTVFDVVILGGGSGGYAAALRAAQLGQSVALIEKGELGGTCLHRGCIPTKALLHAAEIADETKEAAEFGVLATFQGIDINGVHKYKDDVIAGLYKGLQGLVASRKVTFIQGEGRLSSPTSVDVNGQRVQGKHIVLATGSVPKSIPGLNIDGDRVISSDHALKLDRIPQSAVILGGGVIGVEFASVWKSFGVDVTIVEALPHLAPLEDENSSKLLERAFRKAWHQVRAQGPLLRRRVHRDRCPRLHRERQDHRRRPAAGRHRPRPGLGRPRLRGAGRRHGPRLRPGRRVHAHQRADHLGRR
ncbi:hypothetical protein GCM10020229_36060 [Kitasatospora albolonga]